METVKSPVMRYHGGKFRLADWVISFFPEHQCYVEPFGGAAGVLMQKPRSYAEVYNDLDGEIVNVFRVLQDKNQRDQLIEACVLTPFSRDEFAKSYEPADNPVEQARRTLFRAEAGFGSVAALGNNTGFRADAKRAYSLASHIWAKYPDRIAGFGQRLAGVIIENKLAADVITSNDGNDTLFYVDPPYIHDTRVMRTSNGYRSEMTDGDHLELLELLKQVSGFVVLSGYEHPIYTTALKGWQCHRKRARISAGRGAGVREEVIWLNPKTAKAISQPQLFDCVIPQPAEGSNITGSMGS